MFAKLFHDLLFAFRFRNVSDKQAQVRHTDIDFERLPLFDLVIVELWNEKCQMVSGRHFQTLSHVSAIRMVVFHEK